MEVTGIIAEFNPLHNGHVKLLDYSKRKMKASYTIVVMAGDFTQRGIPAMINKYERAKLALKYGADLVIEMPAIAATSTAETFGRTGVALLNATGVVTHLLFGAENPDIKLFTTAAGEGSLNDTMDYHRKINELVAAGDSYAVARQKAMQMKTATPKLPPGFMIQPNNILGVEYVKAIKKDDLPIVPICVERKDSAHNSAAISGSSASGSAIRGAVAAGAADSAKSSVPADVMKLLRFNAQFKTLIRSADVSLLLHNKLISEDDFSEYLECNEDISNKINNLKDKFVEYENFCALLKTKDIIYSRISRVLAHIVLDMKDEDHFNLTMCRYAPYMRILGFNRRGASLLAEIKKNARIPFFLSPQEGMRQLNETQKKILQKDVYTSDVYRTLVTNKSGRVFPTEFTRKFDIKDIT